MMSPIPKKTVYPSVLKVLLLLGGLSVILQGCSRTPLSEAAAAAPPPAAAAEAVDWADMSQGATVVEQKTPRRGDVWGIIGKDGGYRLAGAYPYHFTVDLGGLREIRSLLLSGTNWGMWSPDEFKIEYLNEDGQWLTLVEESDWAKDAQTSYVRTLAEPVQAKSIRFHAEKGGWHQHISDEHKAYVSRVRGNHILLTQFSFYPTTRIPVLLEMVGDVRRLIEEKLRFFGDKQQYLSELGEQSRFNRLLAQYNALAEQIDSGGALQVADYDEALELNQELIALRDQVAIERNRQVLAQREDMGYLAGALAPMERTREDLYSGPLGKTIELQSAKNEYEDVQLAVVAATKPLHEVKIEVSDLVSEDGKHVLSHDNAELFRGVYVTTLEPHYAVDYIGKYFDGLVPMQTGEGLNIEEGKTQIFWLSYFVPPEQPAGVYKGTVTVRPESAEPWTFDVTYTVWDFALPVTSSLKNIFSLNSDVWGKYYGKSWRPSSGMKHGFGELADLWLKHRLNPTNLYISSPLPTMSEAAGYVDKGMNTFNLGRAYGGTRDEAYFQDFLKRIKKYEAELKRMGMEDKAFIYLMDEPFPNEYDQVIDRGRRVKEVTNLPVYAAVNQPVEYYPEAFKEIIDIWGPVFRIYESNRDWFKARQEEGDQVWWYFVNWGFNVDQNPLSARTFTWITWDEELEGVMQWAANRYWHEGQTIDNWEARSYLTHNGLANYVYPGPEGEVYPSARLKHMRDGMEDYEYLVTLRNLLQAEQQLPEPDQAFVQRAQSALDMSELIPAIAKIDNDQGKFIERRKLIGELINEKAHTAAKAE